MAQKLKFGNGTWATKKGSTLSYNDEGGNYKPLPFTTTRNSIATRVNKEGLIEVVGNDVPRIDYTDSADGVLLLENSSTNLVTYSEDFSDSSWTPTPSLVSVSSNQYISPDGSQNADRLQIQSTSSLAILADLVSHTINVDITISAWVKSNTNSVEKIKLFGDYGTTNAVSSEFLVTDTWKRIEFTFTPTATGNRNLGFYNVSNLATDIQIYGFQAEVNDFATSYIPTSGSTLTRVADTASGAGNSEVFNDSQGVLFANIAALSNDGTNRFISLTDGSNDNRVLFGYRAASNQVFARIEGNNSASVDLTNVVSDTEIVIKLAIYYDSSFNYKMYLNGFLVDNAIGTDSIIGLDRFDFTNATGTENFYGKTKEIGYYDTALTDEELEYLTSYRSLNELVTELNLNTL